VLELLLVFHSSTIAMMHGPINIRFTSNSYRRTGAPEFSKVTSFGRSNRLPSLLLLSTFLAGQVYMRLRSAQLPFHVTWSINLLDCLTLFPKFMYHLISMTCISSYFSPLLLLKTCYSAVFSTQCFAPALYTSPSPTVRSKSYHSLYLYSVFGMMRTAGPWQWSNCQVFMTSS